jgi:hypothetical protein
VDKLPESSLNKLNSERHNCTTKETISTNANTTTCQSNSVPLRNSQDETVCRAVSDATEQRRRSEGNAVVVKEARKRPVKNDPRRPGRFISCQHNNIINFQVLFHFPIKNNWPSLIGTMSKRHTSAFLYKDLLSRLTTIIF